MTTERRIRSDIAFLCREARIECLATVGDAIYDQTLLAGMVGDLWVKHLVYVAVEVEMWRE